MNGFDVIVIGSGPGGYVCAIRAAQLGMKTALIEKYNTMGGTCLNVGCIPSKSLLDSSHHYENAIHNFHDHGISIDGKVRLDLEKMMSRKSSVVEQTTKGLEYLMNKNKVTVFNGFGSFENSNKIKIKGVGNGPIDSFINGLSDQLGLEIKVADYHQSAISSGSDAKAAAYIELEKEGKTFWGVGIHPNTTRASFDSIIVGLSKLLSS